MKLKIFIALFVLFASTLSSGSSSQYKPVYAITEKWAIHWYRYYDIQSFKDPMTRKAVSEGRFVNACISITLHESGGDPNLITWEKKANEYAMGMMQILVSTARAVGWKGKNAKELLDPETNAKYAIKYFAEKVVHYQGDFIAGFAAYNAGKCRVGWDGVILNQKYVDCVWPIFDDLNKQAKTL